MVMLALETFPEMDNTKALKKVIENTLLRIVQVIEENNGYLPARTSDKSRAVNVCLGSPGAIPMLMTALQMFPHLQSRLLAISLRVGEVTW
jgi:hypothetical protein